MRIIFFPAIPADDHFTEHQFLIRRVRKFERAFFSLDPHRFVQNFRFRYCSRVQRGLAPSDLQRKLGIIDDTAVPAVAAEIEIRAHENAIDGARIDA